MTVPLRQILLASTTLVWALTGIGTFTQASQMTSDLSLKEGEDSKKAYKKTWKESLEKTLTGSIKKETFGFTADDLQKFSSVAYATIANDPMAQKSLDDKIFNGTSQVIKAALETIFPVQKENIEKFNYNSLILRECLDILKQGIQIRTSFYSESTIYKENNTFREDAIHKFKFYLAFEELDVDLDFYDFFEDKKFYGKIIGENTHQPYLLKWPYSDPNHGKDDPKSYGQYNGYSFKFKYSNAKKDSTPQDDFAAHLQEKVNQTIKEVQEKVLDAHNLCIVPKDIPARDNIYGIPLETYLARKGELHKKQEFEHIQKKEDDLSKIYSEKTIPTSISTITLLAKEVETLKTQMSKERTKAENELQDKMKTLRTQLDEEKEKFQKEQEKEKTAFKEAKDRELAAYKEAKDKEIAAYKEAQDKKLQESLKAKLEEESNSLKAAHNTIEILTKQISDKCTEITKLQNTLDNIHKEHNKFLEELGMGLGLGTKK